MTNKRISIDAFFYDAGTNQLRTQIATFHDHFGSIPFNFTIDGKHKQMEFRIDRTDGPQLSNGYRSTYVFLPLDSKSKLTVVLES